MSARGRPVRYTPEKLRRAVTRYFRSITRVVPVTESVPTGELDRNGHMIYETVPVRNALGEEVRVTEYIIPPLMADLYAALKIDKSTWSNYGKRPEFQEITQDVYERMKAWNERELLKREGKDLKGVIFNLENNYGYRERLDAALHGSVDDLIAQLAAEKGGSGI